MYVLAKNKIEETTVTLTVEETIGSRLGGNPILSIGDINIESMMVQEVDTLAVIKAVVTSTTANEFSEKVKTVWNGSKMAIILKSFCCTFVPYDIIKDTEKNRVINDLIAGQCEILQGNLDVYSPWEKTCAESRIYDLQKELELIE